LLNSTWVWFKDKNIPVLEQPENNSAEGIASLEEVILGGEEQWIHIRSYDISNPLLIYLHGGPGSPCIPYARYTMGGLEHNFIVVTWDQRGCGKSYNDDVDTNSITLAQLYSDTRELILKMINRFGKDRVYLMGASFGSFLGIKMSKDLPDLIHAYIGVGQVVDPGRTFKISLNFALAKATAMNNQTAIQELSTIPNDSTSWDYWWIIKKWLEVYGYGDLYDTSLYAELISELESATEYTAENYSNQQNWENLYNSSPLVQNNNWVKNINLIQQIPGIDIPVYFFAGRYDYKTPSILVEDYYRVLEAPEGKEMIWFENSAHALIFEEKEMFHSEMINVVLKGSLKIQ